MDTKSAIRLLLVDDHSLFRESLGRLLRAEPDFDVAGDCRSGTAALDLLATLHFDVVLLDHDLGDRDGLSFLGAFRDLAVSLGGVPSRILFVTAGMSDEETRAAFERGASGIFLKHSSPADLLTAIRRVAAGERWLDPKAVNALLVGSSMPKQKPSGIAPYTAREQDVLDHIYSGLTNKEIAVKLNISEGYVKAVLQQLFAKTGVRTRSQLVRIALEAQYSRR